MVEAMQRACRFAVRNSRLVALGELKKLRKIEGQTVSDFCVQFERLTRLAHLDMDMIALDTE